MSDGKIEKSKWSIIGSILFYGISLAAILVPLFYLYPVRVLEKLKCHKDFLNGLENSFVYGIYILFIAQLIFSAFVIYILSKVYSRKLKTKKIIDLEHRIDELEKKGN